MRRLWVAAVVLLLAGCGTAGGTRGASAGATGGGAPTHAAGSTRPSTSPTAARTRTSGVPDAADWTAISRAVHASRLTSSVPDHQYVVVGLELAGRDGQWAGGMIEPRKPDALQPVAVLLHFTHGRWRLVDLGTAMVGCGIAPRPVLEQLRFFDVPPHC